MEHRLLQDVEGAERAIISPALAYPDESLRIRWYALLVLDLLLYGHNRVAWLDVQGDRLPREGLHKLVVEGGGGCESGRRRRRRSGRGEVVVW